MAALRSKNEDIAQHFTKAFASGDVAALQEIVAEDVLDQINAQSTALLTFWMEVRIRLALPRSHARLGGSGDAGKAPKFRLRRRGPELRLLLQGVPAPAP